MIAAAGIMIVAPCPVTGKDTALLLLRGGGSDHPFEWAFPGGQLEGAETTAQAAVRECKEECGLEVAPKALGQVLTRGIAKAETVVPAETPDEGAVVVPSQDVDFTAYRYDIDRQFAPELCAEHIGYCWAPLDRPPQPLHPGCAVTLERPRMNELDVARAMAAGSLVSPQLYENMALFAIRITATGAAYRTRIGEYVWRDPALYLNDEFLARCAGLPVIWEHPEASTLTSKEYRQRNVGSVMLAYIQGSDVWAIARVYDMDAIREMVKNQVSTSPAVVFRDPEGNERATMEDGSKVLVETAPDLLDHIAICAKGVWDKGGEAMGVDRSAAAEPGAVADSVAPLAVADRSNLRGRALSLRARSLGLMART